MGMVIDIREIGLAAFMKMKGCKVVSYDGHIFVMDTGHSHHYSDRDFDDWSLSYTNSCCCSHDNNLLQLRDMVRRHNNS